MKANFNVQLYKNRKNVWLVSFSLCLISIIGMLICLKSTSIKAPLNLGLDYTGGTQITLERSCIDECITLFYLGTGFVKGFAATLGIGVVLSLFTALTCTKAILKFLMSYQGLRKISNFINPNQISSPSINVQ